MKVKVNIKGEEREIECDQMKHSHTLKGRVS